MGSRGFALRSRLNSGGLLLGTVLLLLTFQNCTQGFQTQSLDSPVGLLEESVNSSVGLSQESSASGSNAANPASLSPVQFAACKEKASELCAVWSSQGQEVQVSLSIPASTVMIESAAMGSHSVMGSTQRLVYVYFMLTSTESQVSILSLEAKRVIAATRANAGAPIWGTNLGIIRGPQGLKYPFLSPGYVTQISSSSWMWMCRFDPTLISGSSSVSAPTADCGTGFRRWSIDFKDAQGTPAYQAAVTKHSGYMIADVDADGWDDVTFPFFQGHLVTFSGRTGAQIGFSKFDVAAAEGDYLPYYRANTNHLFHGGRLYGVFSEVKSSSVPFQVVVAGDIVGRFQDGGEWCNSTRYAAGFRWSNGYQLAWSRYVGWGRTLFNDDGSAVRPGNEAGRCIHRIADPVFEQDSRAYVIFNQFNLQDPAAQCDRLAIQYQANVASTEAANKYIECLASISAQKPGSWAINVLDASNGSTVSTLGDHYVWGRVDGIWPNKPGALYLLHQNYSEGNFAQTAQNMKAFTLAYMDKGQFFSVAVMDCPSAVPVLREGTIGGNSYGTYPYGKNTSTDNVGMRDIALKDVDGDGLKDIPLADGRSIGYSNGQLVYKGGPRPMCVKRAQIKWQSNGLLNCRIDNGAVLVSSNSNADRAGAWPTAPMGGGYVTADLNQQPLVNFSCTSPSGWASGLEDFKLTFRIRSSATDGYWAAQDALACGITGDAGVVTGGQGDGRAMSGYFNTIAFTGNSNLSMECASPWGWNNAINDRQLKVQILPR